MSDSDCPVAGCETPRRHEHLMCRRHWYMVPLDLRREVLGTIRQWRRLGDEGDWQRWEEARSLALASVELAERSS